MKKSKYDLSVIVPVYNSEKFLRRCVDSILNQTYKDFELVLVDDGSTDNSSALCDQYAEIDDRVSVLHKKNSGPFQARKSGAQTAKGEILTFSDADDWLEDNALEMVMNIFEKYSPDMVAYEYVCENREAEKYFYTEKLYSSEEIKNEMIPRMMYDCAIGRGHLSPSLCCKFIRKDIFIKITRAVKDRITLGEDALVTYPAVCMIKSIFIYNKALYHYSNNHLSCTHVFPIKRLSEIKAFQENLTRLLKEINMLEELQYQAENYVRLLLSMMIKEWYGLELSSISFKFPDHLVPEGSKVFIYGAGDVGKSYINELKLRNYAGIAGWADQVYGRIRSYHNVRLAAPESIMKSEFDLLLIAVWDSDTAYKIKENLISKGIPEKKIIWERPIHIL